MAGKPKRLNHPIAAYLVGTCVVGIILAVFAGVVYHFTFSPDAPEIISPVRAKFMAAPQSEILAEAKQQEEFETHRHFHNIVEWPQLDETDRPVCFICHSDFPHSKNKKVRSLLNMHTQYFVCEACHLKQDEEKPLLVEYKWYSPHAENPAGPFFGTHYDDESGNLAVEYDKLAKMAPYLRKGVQLESAIQKQDAPLAKDYMKVRDKLSPEQRDGVKNKFHQNVKDKGHECQSCHQPEKPLLNYAQLGFSPKRIEDIQQLNIKGMITKYEEFYLPKLFN